jgi:hypothetical protein
MFRKPRTSREAAVPALGLLLRQLTHSPSKPASPPGFRNEENQSMVVLHVLSGARHTEANLRNANLLKVGLL